MKKSSPVLNMPSKTLKTDEGFELILYSTSQERSATQKDLVISHLCSRDSISYVLKEYLVYLAETRHPDILYEKVNWKFFCVKITVADELPRPAPTPDRK